MNNDTKIIDIYNLINLNKNSDINTIQIYFEQNKIISLKTNNVEVNINTNLISNSGSYMKIKLDNIIKLMNLTCVVSAIKIKVHNIKTHLHINSNLYMNSNNVKTELYDEQIIFYQFTGKFELNINNFDKLNTGNIQFIIKPLKLKFQHNYLVYMDTIKNYVFPNFNYIFELNLISIEVWTFDNNIIDKVIKKIHIGFKSKAKKGILEFELYKPQFRLDVYVLSKIILNEQNITIKNIKCDCERCLFLNKFKSLSNFYNKTYMCDKAMDKIKSILQNDYKINHFVVDKDEFLQKICDFHLPIINIIYKTIVY